MFVEGLDQVYPGGPGPTPTVHGSVLLRPVSSALDSFAER